MQANSGYHDCPCRDCFEIAIGCDDDDNPDLCSECEEAGCDPDGESECSHEHSLDDCDEDEENNEQPCNPSE